MPRAVWVVEDASGNPRWASAVPITEQSLDRPGLRIVRYVPEPEPDYQAIADALDEAQTDLDMILNDWDEPKK